MREEEFRAQFRALQNSKEDTQRALKYQRNTNLLNVGVSVAGDVTGAARNVFRQGIAEELDDAFTQSQNNPGELQQKISNIKSKHSPLAVNLFANDVFDAANRQTVRLSTNISQTRKKLRQEELLQSAQDLVGITRNEEQFGQGLSELVNQYQSEVEEDLSDETLSKLSRINERALGSYRVRADQSNEQIATNLVESRINDVLSSPQSNAQDIRNAYNFATTTLSSGIRKGGLDSSNKEIATIAEARVQKATDAIEAQAQKYLYTMLQNSTNPEEINQFKDIIKDPVTFQSLRSKALHNQQQILKYNQNAIKSEEKEYKKNFLDKGVGDPTHTFNDPLIEAQNQYNVQNNFTRMSAVEILAQPAKDVQEQAWRGQYANNYITDFDSNFPKAAIDRGFAAPYEFQGLVLPEVKDGMIVGDLDEVKAQFNNYLDVLRRVQDSTGDGRLVNIRSPEMKQQIDNFFKNINPDEKYRFFNMYGDLASDRGMDAPNLVGNMFGNEFTWWYNHGKLNPDANSRAFVGYQILGNSSADVQRNTESEFNAAKKQQTIDNTGIISTFFGPDSSRMGTSFAALDAENEDFLKKLVLGLTVNKVGGNDIIQQQDISNTFAKYFSLNEYNDRAYVTSSYDGKLNNNDIVRYYNNIRDSMFPQEWKDFLKDREVAFETTPDLTRIIVYYLSPSGANIPIVINDEIFSIPLPAVPS